MNKSDHNRLEQAALFILFPLVYIPGRAIQMWKHHASFVGHPRMDGLKQNIHIKLINPSNKNAPRWKTRYSTYLYSSGILIAQIYNSIHPDIVTSPKRPSPFHHREKP